MVIMARLTDITKKVRMRNEDKVPEGMSFVKVDRNGSKHYEGQIDCPKCGGVGLICHHVENGVPSWNWTDGGVCWKCSGTGKVHGKIIIRTPEYEAVLQARRQKKQEEQQKKIESEYNSVHAESLKQWGFTEAGNTFLFLGNTFEQKDAIKATGAKFNQVLGWHIDHQVEGFEFLEVHFEHDDFMIAYDGKIYDINTTRKYSREHVNFLKKQEEERLHPVKHYSEYQGQVKERMKGLKLTVIFETTFAGQRPARYSGYYDDTKFFYSMIDEEGNIFTWTASSPMGISSIDSNGHEYYKSINKGDTVILDGTVKDHKEYKGDKQTVLTRCKVHNIA